MYDARTRWTVIGAVLLILLGSGVGLYASRRSAPAPIVITRPAATASPPPTAVVPLPVAAPPDDPPPATPAAPKPVSAPVPKYYVHVAGAVKKPSLYLLAPGSRVMQALKAAGGPTTRADLDSINLAEKIKDGEKIYVPRKAAAAPMLAPPGNALGHETIIPDTAPSVPAPSAVVPAKAPKAAKTAAGKPGKLTSPSQGQVNINTAGADQLQRLPGIGPAMAARVLAFRQQVGGFKQLEDLQEVGGIGPKKYAKIAPLVKLK